MHVLESKYVDYEPALKWTLPHGDEMARPKFKWLQSDVLQSQRQIKISDLAALLPILVPRSWMYFCWATWAGTKTKGHKGGHEQKLSF